MILVNRVAVEDNDIIDYIVDGILDRRLQDQARIMRFKSQSDMLEAFKGLSLQPKEPADYEPKKFVIQEQKNQRERRTMTGESPISPKENPTSLSESPRRRIIKCYNCCETGHRASTCPQPKETKELCHHCGSINHLQKDCPKKEELTSSPTDTTAKTMNLVEPIFISDPYYIQLKFTVKEIHNSDREYSVNAAIDPGSPVSLIKCEYIPISIRTDTT